MDGATGTVVDTSVTDTAEAAHATQSRCSRCSYCGLKKEKLFKCSKCLSASYCDATHQKLHWKTHKPRCRLDPVTVAGVGTLQCSAVGSKLIGVMHTEKSELQEAIVRERERQVEMSEGRYPSMDSTGTGTGFSASYHPTLEKKCEAPGCDVLTSQVCSKCKAVSVCSSKCMALLWPDHKPRCKAYTVAMRSPPAQDRASRATDNPLVSAECSPVFLEEVYKKRAEICERYGIEGAPAIGADVFKDTRLSKGGGRAAYFADMLTLYDAGNDMYKHQGLLKESFLLNRAYNNTYAQATLVLNAKELDTLHALMARRRIGDYYRNGAR
jgi:hypothetical protein